MNDGNTANPFVRKLARCMPLDDGEISALEGIACRDETYVAGKDILALGASPRFAFFVKDGMAIRYRLLADGSRQILGFMVPGDMSGPETFLAREMDHSIGVAVPVRLSIIERESLLAALASHPRIALCLLWAGMQDEAILRERIVALGRRDARGRVAYLLCDLLWRHQAVGLARGANPRLKLTQTRVADSLGLTPVHVNRVMRQFQKENLVGIERGVMVVEDEAGLQAIADFDRGYLHLSGIAESSRQALSAPACVPWAHRSAEIEMTLSQ